MLGWEFYAAAVVFVIVTIAIARHSRRSEENEGYVYFIGGRTSGPIKIGVTRNDPHERLKDLQTGNAVRLKVHAAFLAVEDLYETEGLIHNALADYHVGGEWYEREPSLVLMREMMREDAA